MFKVSGSTTLHLSAAGGFHEIVSLLLDNGAHPLDENDVSNCRVWTNLRTIKIAIYGTLFTKQNGPYMDHQSNEKPFYVYG